MNINSKNNPKVRMKKIAHTTLLFICLVSSAASSKEAFDGFFFKPYLGASYNRYDIDFKTVPATAFNFSDFAQDALHGGQVHVGARVHQYLGFEASYFRALKETKTGPANITTSNYGDGFGLDVMGYYPIDSTNIELIGTVGIAYTSYTGNSSNTDFSVNTNELKGRLGAGVQYWLCDALNLRALVRYQDAEFAGKTAGTINGTSSDAIISSVGINWQF